MHLLAEVSAILAIVAVIPYIYGVFTSTVRPERASWFVWTALIAVSLVSQIAAGGGESLGLVVGDLIATVIVLAVSLFKGTGGLTRFDLSCLVLAAIGIIVWQISSQPIVAIVAVVFADMIGSLPTIRKAYNDPASELWITYFITTVAALLAVIAVGRWAFVLLVYPVYILFANAAVVVAIKMGSIRKENCV
jgi:hypothetical protein